MLGGNCTSDGICTVPCDGSSTDTCGDNGWACESGMCEKLCYSSAECLSSQVSIIINASQRNFFKVFLQSSPTNNKNNTSTVINIVSCMDTSGNTLYSLVSKKPHS